MSSKFSPIALDNLINEVAGSINDIDDELSEYNNDQLPSVMDPSINNLVDQKQGMTVDFKRTYAQLEKLLENGNNAMSILQAIDPDVSTPETVHAVTSLISALKSVIAEFNKIHLLNIKYNQTLNLLEVKHQHKLKEIELKKTITTEKAVDAQVIPEWNSAEMQEFMEWKREKMMKKLEAN